MSSAPRLEARDLSGFIVMLDNTSLLAYDCLVGFSVLCNKNVPFLPLSRSIFKVKLPPLSNENIPLTGML